MFKGAILAICNGTSRKRRHVKCPYGQCLSVVVSQQDENKQTATTSRSLQYSAACIQCASENLSAVSAQRSGLTPLSDAQSPRSESPAYIRLARDKEVSSGNNTMQNGQSSALNVAV